MSPTEVNQLFGKFSLFLAGFGRILVPCVMYFSFCHLLLSQLFQTLMQHTGWLILNATPKCLKIQDNRVLNWPPPELATPKMVESRTCPLNSPKLSDCPFQCGKFWTQLCQGMTSSGLSCLCGFWELQNFGSSIKDQPHCIKAILRYKNFRSAAFAQF